jgi:chemotaxis signal transduction protein
MMLVAQAADLKIGLMVDRVESIYRFPFEWVISPPFRLEPGLVAYLRGAVDRDGQMIRVLECERLLRGPKMQQFS